MVVFAFTSSLEDRRQMLAKILVVNQLQQWAHYHRSLWVVVCHQVHPCVDTRGKSVLDHFRPLTQVAHGNLSKLVDKIALKLVEPKGLQWRQVSEVWIIIIITLDCGLMWRYWRYTMEDPWLQPHVKILKMNNRTNDSNSCHASAKDIHWCKPQW